MELRERVKAAMMGELGFPDAMADAALEAVHDYLYEHAEMVSNLRKPYRDNDFGRAAAMVMRCMDSSKIDKILNSPPYI